MACISINQIKQIEEELTKEIISIVKQRYDIPDNLSDDDLKDKLWEIFDHNINRDSTPISLVDSILSYPSEDFSDDDRVYKYKEHYFVPTNDYGDFSIELVEEVPITRMEWKLCKR